MRELGMERGRAGRKRREISYAGGAGGRKRRGWIAAAGAGLAAVGLAVGAVLGGGKHRGA